MLARAYTSAPTVEEDVTHARGALQAFAAEHGLRIVGWYAENDSGARRARPELFRLLADCDPGDVLLVERVDRLLRLSAGDRARLRREVDERGVRVVALDVPTSHALATVGATYEFTARTFAAMSAAMLLDVLAAIVRKDYKYRRRRQREGIDAAKSVGKYRGRPEDQARLARIAQALRNGLSWSSIQAAEGCSRPTVAKVAARLRAAGRSEG